MEEVKKKRGRPLKDGSRRNQVRTVMNDEELFRLKKISKKSGLSQMNIMRIGAAMFIGELEKLYPDVEIDYEELYEEGMYDSINDDIEEDTDED